MTIYNDKREETYYIYLDIKNVDYNHKQSTNRMYCKKEKKVKASILKDMHPTNDKIYKNLNSRLYIKHCI